MCLKFSSILILVNGNPTKEFRTTRGLWLNRLVREASRIGILEGIIVENKGAEAKLLQFVDDTKFFLQIQLYSSY